ncbi:hypothetical protein [Petrimonas sulfuriphila]|uniref:hypothetical protein n=1 Tax=Petrimonas sulfuriphila TaxID=285070 RepID=UPI003EB76DE5
MDTTSDPKRVLVETAVTVNKPLEEVYAYWRKFENLPFYETPGIGARTQRSSFRMEWIFPINPSNGKVCPLHKS